MKSIYPPNQTNIIRKFKFNLKVDPYLFHRIATEILIYTLIKSFLIQEYKTIEYQNTEKNYLTTLLQDKYSIEKDYKYSVIATAFLINSPLQSTRDDINEFTFD